MRNAMRAWRTFAMRIMTFFATTTAFACTDQTVVRRLAGTQQAQQLVGLWDVRLRLDRPLTLHTPSADTAHAELTLIPNAWVVGTYPEISAPTNYGTYDGDLSAFGFDPRETGQIPVAIATRTGGDSVEVVLAPGRAESVTLRGRLHGDSVTGTWGASVFHFGCGGRFVMVRREPRAAPAVQSPTSRRFEFGRGK